MKVSRSFRCGRELAVGQKGGGVEVNRRLQCDGELAMELRVGMNDSRRSECDWKFSSGDQRRRRNGISRGQGVMGMEVSLMSERLQIS